MLEKVSCILCGFSAVFSHWYHGAWALSASSVILPQLKKKNPGYTTFWQSVSLDQCSCPHVNRSKPSIYLLVMPSPPFLWVPILPPQPPPELDSTTRRCVSRW